MPDIKNKGHFKEYTRTAEEQRLYDVEDEVAKLKKELAELKAATSSDSTSAKKTSRK